MTVCEHLVRFGFISEIGLGLYGFGCVLIKKDYLLRRYIQTLNNIRDIFAYMQLFINNKFSNQIKIQLAYAFFI